MDRFFRAYDAKTGEVLWRYELPFAAQSTPISYKRQKNSRQFIVAAAGGHSALGVTPGDTLIAFST